jgi:hypothetical protein
MQEGQGDTGACVCVCESCVCVYVCMCRTTASYHNTTLPTTHYPLYPQDIVLEFSDWVFSTDSTVALTIFTEALDPANGDTIQPLVRV